MVGVDDTPDQAHLEGAAAAYGFITFAESIRSYLAFRRLEDVCGGPGSLDEKEEDLTLDPKSIELIFADDPEPYAPPSWLHEGAKLWHIGFDLHEDGCSSSYLYEASRLRLRETPEDSTVVITNLDAPEQILCEGGSYPNLEKTRSLTVAYVLQRFAAATNPERCFHHR